MRPSDSSLRFHRATITMKHMLSAANLQRNQPGVFDAFMRACGSKKHALTALKWGAGPAIVVSQGLIRIPGTNDMACGVTRVPLVTSYVQVSDRRVIPLEECTYVDLDANRRRFESTVLHELVHWARFQAGLMDQDYDNFPDHPDEAGNQFEQWAYGELTCSHDDLEASRSTIF